MKRFSIAPMISIAAWLSFVGAWLGAAMADEVVTPISKDKSDADDVGSSIERRLRLERLFRADEDSNLWLDKWRVTRDGMIDKVGLNFSASYHQLSLVSFGDGDHDTGFGGDFTLNGLWHFGGKNWDIPFELNFRMRHRHAFGDTAPSGVASQTGALWGLVDGFSDKGFEIPDLFLVQKFPQHGIELRYGQMVIDAQFDRHALRSSKQAFLNRAFSSNPAVAFPRFGVGITLERQCSGGIDYALGFSSVQGTQAGTQVDLDLGSNSYFTAGQVGWDFKIRVTLPGFK